MPRPLALAVDFGGTKVEAALVDDRGRLVPGTRHRSATGATASSDELEAAVSHVVSAARASLPERCLARRRRRRRGRPGRRRTGTSPHSTSRSGAGYPLRDLIAGLVPEAPVTLRIDGLCIALAEYWVGAGRNATNLLGMIVSTGVGGGLVLGGRAAPSPTGNGGHIGHVEVGGFDDVCACGGRGCLEAVASGPRTVAWARMQGFTGETGEDLSIAHAAGDPIAIAAVERAGTAIGHAVASAANLLDLDVVAIGGGFSRVSPALFEHARAALVERSAFPFVARVQVVPSGLSDEGPLVGAAALVHRPEFIA